MLTVDFPQVNAGVTHNGGTYPTRLSADFPVEFEKCDFDAPTTPTVGSNTRDVVRLAGGYDAFRDLVSDEAFEEDDRADVAGADSAHDRVSPLGVVVGDVEPLDLQAESLLDERELLAFDEASDEDNGFPNLDQPISERLKFGLALGHGFILHRNWRRGRGSPNGKVCFEGLRTLCSSRSGVAPVRQTPRRSP